MKAKLTALCIAAGLFASGMAFAATPAPAAAPAATDAPAVTAPAKKKVKKHAAKKMKKEKAATPAS
jgi:ribosomal protein L12E/L44/L45/RPP1/RPP2